MTDPGSPSALARAARSGLCAHCRWARSVVSARGSAFVLCGASGEPKYPMQPRLACPSFEGSRLRCGEDRS